MAGPDDITKMLKNLLLGQERTEKMVTEQISELKEQVGKQAALLAALAATRGVASPDTPAQLGHQNMETLVRLGNVRVLEPGVGPSILTLQQQTELASLPVGGAPEAAIVHYMAPHLRTLRQPGAGEPSAADPVPLVMVNSEAYVWLVHPSVLGVANQRLKPDLFLTWAPFVELRGDDQSFPHGVLASPALQTAGCVAELFEGKNGALGSEDFGKQCLYHKCISGQFKSALFNQEQCWLLETMHGNPVRLLKMHWTTPGSVHELQGFLGALSTPPLVQLLRRMLTDQKLATLSPAGRCHLGSGASGHVFVVHRTIDATRTPLALKLVPKVYAGELHSEFTQMLAAAAAGAPVVAPVPDSLRIYPGNVAAAAASASAEALAPPCASGGYLLSRVGVRFATTTKGGVKAAFAALAALHACRIYHGDARTANLLDIGGQALWIDLRTGIVDAGGEGPLPLEQQEFDAAVLARSILPQHRPVPPSLQGALRLYNAALPGTVADLAQAVWDAL